jgi:hypothetical protein
MYKLLKFNVITERNVQQKSRENGEIEETEKELSRILQHNQVSML